MSYFDLIINMTESIISILFIYIIFNTRKRLLSYFIFVGINFLSISLCNYFSVPEITLILLSIVILFTYSNYLNHHKHLQNIFIALFINTLLNVATTLSICFSTLLAKFPIDSVDGYHLMAMISKPILLVLVLATASHIKKYYFLESQVLKYITISIVLLNFIYSVTVDYIFYGDNLNSTLTLLLLLIDALTICLCFVFFEAQREQYRILELQRKSMKIENLETIQSINENNYQQLRNWKHDIIHVFNAIKYQLTNKNYNEAFKIINEYNHNLNSNNFVQSSGNELLDYLLLQKVNQIKDKEIHLITSCHNTIGPLEDAHFFIIVGNLIDNAIENCYSNFNKQLWVSIGTKPEYYFISIKNSIKDSVLAANPDLNTTKVDSEHHGIGINNVRLLVNHYQGLIKFEEDEGYFIVKILIPNNPAS